MVKRSAETSASETAASISLDAKKRVTVRLFNGIKLVDIREYYEDKNTKEWKPGSKGISLNELLWKKLLESQDEITEALGRLGKRAKTDTSEGDKDKEEKEKEKKGNKETTDRDVKDEE